MTRRVNGYLFAARGKPGRFKCPRQARTPDRGKRRGAQPEQAAVSLPWRAQSALRRGAWRGRAGRRGRHNETTHRDKSSLIDTSTEFSCYLDFDDEYTRNLQLAFTLSILAEIFVLKNTIMTACSMCHARRGSTSCNGAISIGVVSCIATCFYLIALSLVASTSAKLHQDLGGATSLGGGFACQTVCFFLTIGATITGFNFARALRRNARSAGMGVAITSAPPVVAAPVMAHNQYAY